VAVLTHLLTHYPVKKTHLSQLVSLFTTGLFLLLVGHSTVAQTPTDRVFTANQLRTDFQLMRRALEEAHPALYRYQTRDSANRAFEAVEQQLNRPMTESEFRRVIHPVVSRIGCGHTSLEYSSALTKYRKKNKIKPLPITIFLDADNRLFITANNSTDASVKRGTEILRLNGQSVAALQEQIYSHVSSDGYNQTVKRLITNLRFDKFFRYVTGYEGDSLALTLRDSVGAVREVLLRPRPAKKPAADSLAKPQLTAKPTKTENKPETPKKRSLTFSKRDSSVAVLTLNTFSGGGQKRFFRQSFQTLAGQPHIKTLVLDLRANGGGSSDACVRLLQYLIARPFQPYSEGDAPIYKPSFNRHLNQKFDRFVGRLLFNTKTPQGTYRRRGVGAVYKPMKNSGFGGKLLVLISGNTFSAAAITASLLQLNERNRTTFIGRETGGGRYGCSAFVTPYLRLPETGVNLRFPLYKITLPVPGTDEGRGVMPDILINGTIRDVLANKDLDLEKALEMTAKQ
jgi:hypothetical protein